MTDTPPASTSLRPLQWWGSALAVVATAAVTVICLAEMAPDEVTGRSLLYGAQCLLFAIAPPLAFWALSLSRYPSIEAAWAQLLTTLSVAGFLMYGYLDVAFQAFGPHRHSSTEGAIFILAPLAAFPLGAWVFALVWGVGKLLNRRGGRAEPERAPISRAGESEQAQEGAGPGEVGRPRRQGLEGALILAIVLGVAYLNVASYQKRQAAKDPSTPPDVLARLAENEKLQYYVAGNPSTPRSTLARLAALPNPVWTTKTALARNPSTPPEVLCELAELTPRPGSSEWEIRMEVESNRSTPPPVVRALRRLQPPSNPAGQDWKAWPKDSQPDCAQFAQSGPALPGTLGAPPRAISPGTPAVTPGPAAAPAPPPLPNASSRSRGAHGQAAERR
ncbi:MAG: variant leucine-rich repeat-containing protein [Myxococcales bacterium]